MATQAFQKGQADAQLIAAQREFAEIGKSIKGHIHRLIDIKKGLRARPDWERESRIREVKVRAGEDYHSLILWLACDGVLVDTELICADETLLCDAEVTQRDIDDLNRQARDEGRVRRRRAAKASKAKAA